MSVHFLNVEYPTKSANSRCPAREMIGLHQFELVEIEEYEVLCEDCDYIHRTFAKRVEVCSCGETLDASRYFSFGICGALEEACSESVSIEDSRPKLRLV